MEKINWENGELIKGAFVTIDNTEYPVTPDEIDGTTPLDADTLNLMQDNIEDAIDELKTQKILWSGGSYMNNTQTINLSETVSSQNNGIVLIWSAYSGSAAQNSNFVFNYIPKKAVELVGGSGVFQSMGGDEGIVAYKYVYVRNDRIVGHANNSGTHTSGGITYNNSRFVLRYVIGV